MALDLIWIISMLSLEYDDPNKTYRITEAGLRVLELHNKIIENANDRIN